MKIAPLTDICSLITDGTHYTPPDLGTGHPFLTVKDISEGELDFANCARISDTELARARDGNSCPRPGDILFSKDGTVGKVHVVQETTPPFAVLSSIAILRPSSEIDSRYLSYALRTPSVQGQAVRRKSGSAIRRIILSDLKQVEIPVPPLEEQRRIAAILDQADALRFKRRQVWAHLEGLAASIFLDLFGKTDAKRVPFQSVVTTMRNGISPSKVGTTVATVLTLSAVTHGSFDPFAVKASTFLEEPPPEMRVSAKDFLICRGNGNRALVGVGVHPQQDRPDFVFPDTVIAARIDKEEIDPTYLQAAWKQPAVRRQIEAAARTTSGIHKVNQQSLGAIELLLPPLIEQREFARRVTAIPRPGLTELDELFNSLQSRAFSGQL